MTRPIFCSVALATLFCSQAVAHDFWIEPGDYQPGAPGSVNLEVLVGHGEDMSDWPVAPHRIIGLRSIGPDGLVSHVRGNQSLSGDVALKFETEGLHMVFMETTNSVSTLEAEKFNAYVEDEGLLPILADRAASQTMNIEGRELYSRRGKALIKVGCTPDEAAGSVPVWRQQQGLTLEVIPLVNPFDWQDDEPFPVEVRFHGERLPGATLHVTNLADDEQAFSLTTNSGGQADISGDLSEGRWLVHTVWAETAPRLLEDADYQTVFSSLTFETGDDCDKS